jgi:hypothetical protein
VSCLFGHPIAAASGSIRRVFKPDDSRAIDPCQRTTPRMVFVNPMPSCTTTVRAPRPPGFERPAMGIELHNPDNSLTRPAPSRLIKTSAVHGRRRTGKWRLLFSLSYSVLSVYVILYSLHEPSQACTLPQTACSASAGRSIPSSFDFSRIPRARSRRIC